MKQLNISLRRASIRGFTIVELMTVISIIGVLAAIATPTFREIKRNSELTSATNSLMSAINTARTEAMKRGKNAIIAPTTGGNWNTGITVFVDNNMDNAFDAADAIVLQTEVLPNYFTITHTPFDATRNYTLFNGSGYARTMTESYNATFEIARNDITGANLLNQTRRIKVSLTGRVKSCKPDSNPDTKCLASSAD